MQAEIAYGKFVLLAFCLGLPIRMLGIFVRPLAFLDSSLTTALVFGLSWFYSVRFERVAIESGSHSDPAAPTGQSMIEQTIPNARSFELPVQGIVIVWFIYGLLVWDGISRGYLGRTPILAWEAVGQWIPSIQQLNAAGREWPKLHASMLISAMPILFLALLLTDMKQGLERVIAKGKQDMALVFFILLGIVVFFVGFDSRRLNANFFIFSLGSSLLTVGSTYFLVLGLRLARVNSRKPIANAAEKSEEELAIEHLRALIESQARISAIIPPTAEIQSAIRYLGRQHGIDDECRGALSDLSASPPLISQRVVTTASRLLAVSDSPICPATPTRI